VYYSSILVSVTETCTVGCKHCGFTGAIRVREAEPDQVSAWVTQACDFGIPTIIFTGGEPFQRFKLLKAGVHAAGGHPAKPRIGVFTSSFWGRDERAVGTILDQLPGLDHLYLSTDVFHQEQVPAQYVINVIEGAIARDIPHLSLCITIAADSELDRILPLYERFSDRVLIHVDRVISTPFISTAPTPGKPALPGNFANDCYLRTPIINPNGDLCACHVAKYGAHRPLRNEVYFLGNLHQETFGAIMDRADDDYEYQFLRVFGPQGVARLVQQSSALRDYLGPREFSNGCDLCSKVLLTGPGKQALREWVTDPFQRELIDAARQARFGEDRPVRLGTAG